MRGARWTLNVNAGLDALAGLFPERLAPLHHLPAAAGGSPFRGGAVTDLPRGPVAYEIGFFTPSLGPSRIASAGRSLRRSHQGGFAMGVFSTAAGDLNFDNQPERDLAALEGRLVVIRHQGIGDMVAGRLIGTPQPGFALHLLTESGAISVPGWRSVHQVTSTGHANQ